MSDLKAALRGKYALILAIAAIVVVRVLTSAFGFNSVAGDEYSRVLLAASWADSPYLFEDSSIAWLPGHLYLMGLALKIHYDLVLTPRIVTLLFAAVSLTMLYLLSSRLFNRDTAIIAILLVGLLPVHVYLSLTPAVDTVYVALLISFLYFFLLWLDNLSVKYLLVSAALLAAMTFLRYEGWFIAVAFCFYLLIRWFRSSPRTLFPPLSWLIAVALVCFLPCAWLLWNYIHWGNPFNFISVFTIASKVGPLTEISPHLGYFELVLLNSGLIFICGLLGMLLARRENITGIVPYFLFALAPFIVLALLKPQVGSAYPPRYMLQYLVPLSPFAAYLIWFASSVDNDTSLPRWRMAGSEMLLITSLYNLWVVYLFLSNTRASLILVLTISGITLSYRLLDYKHWRNLSLSFVPLVIFIVLYKAGISAQDKNLHAGIYLFTLFVFYVYCISRNIGAQSGELSSSLQWRTAGIGFFVIICLYNSAVTFTKIPHWEPPGSVEAGFVLRQMFEEGILEPSDKMLVEVDHKNYKIMQLISNHPRNIILDRSPNKVGAQKSFLVDANQRAHKVARFYTSYEAINTPVFTTLPPDINAFSAETGVRLIVIKDPHLAQIIGRESSFDEVMDVSGYTFYLMGNRPTPARMQVIEQ